VTDVADPHDGLAGGLGIDERDGTVLFGVHAVPGSKGESVAGLHGGALKVKVRSRAEKGRANRDVVSLLATVLGVRRSEVEIVSGHTSRAKRVKVSGVTADEVLAQLASVLDVQR
jgi:uncharacterized protein (TIGR00251 family)